MWQHNYEPVGGSLAMSTPVAAIPILVLFVMLGVLRKPAWLSALSALGSALIVALFAYGMPVPLALISTTEDKQPHLLKARAAATQDRLLAINMARLQMQ